MKLKKHAPDITVVLGGFIITTGLWLIYPPIALIFLGLLLTGIGLLAK